MILSNEEEELGFFVTELILGNPDYAPEIIIVFYATLYQLTFQQVMKSNGVNFMNRFG
jgi:hypothetical protein